MKQLFSRFVKGAPMPAGHMFLEKRSDTRVPIKIPVKYQVLDDQNEINSVIEDGKKDRSAHTMDLSVKGMCIVTQQTLKKGNILRIDISLSGHPALIRAFAQVVWANDTGGGLKFLSIKDEGTLVLRAYLDKAVS